MRTATSLGANAVLAGFVISGLAGVAPPAVAQTNAAPQITTTGPLSAEEGTTAVATLAATDADTSQNDLVWSISGGGGGTPPASR